jgi:hypothetical protein
MRRFVPALLLLTVAAQPVPQRQVDWQWERDTPMCALRQAYSPDGNVIVFSGTPASGNSIYIGGIEPMLAPSKSLLGGKLRFYPGGESDAEISIIEGKGRRDISASSEDPAFVSKFAGASAIEITQEKLGTMRVPLRSAAAAVEAVRSCEDTKMRDWGIDPVAWRALKAPPKIVTRWTDLIDSDDYPIGALLNGSQGHMILRFQIGADGSVRDCQRLIRGQPVQQRVRLCSKLKKLARFKPAVASTGEPVASPYVLVINFRLV